MFHNEFSVDRESQTFEKKKTILSSPKLLNTPVYFVRMAEAQRFDNGRVFNGKNFFIY